MPLRLTEASPLGKAAKKLQRYRTGATTYEVTGLPYCDEPVRVHREQRPHDIYTGLSLDMFAPCRKCTKCLYFRSQKWAERMAIEIDRSARTWMVTLTFSPMHLSECILRAYKLQGLSHQLAVQRVAYSHVQLYLKRLRKSGARFRFVAVPEYGEANGRLHFHMLLHEHASEGVTKRLLEEQWPSHVHARLVRKETTFRASRYVSKYLTKALGKPHASLHYGTP